MMPIGPLMIEHRLIEKMVRRLAEEWSSVERTHQVNERFIEEAVDFFSTYADRCHHGKEEDILFREMRNRKVDPELLKIMEELIQDHITARGLVRQLRDATSRYSAGERSALDEISHAMAGIIELYPKHIEKEDKNFFLNAMDVFTKQERDKMLNEFNEFDRQLIHEKYRAIVERLSKDLPR